MTATYPHAAAPDADLLRRYVATRSPDAFAALVDRYLPLIYSAAVRQTRDPHLAEDVAQATLLLFSERAGRIDPAVLPGWLLKAAHYAARNAVRQRTRRLAHEQRAAAMRPETDSPAGAGADADPDALSHVIDPALARLGDADRTAVVLRFLQGKSFADIATHLRTTEAAAQRRVSRAVEKLRTILTGRGVAVTPAALPAALGSHAMHPVPPALAGRASSLASLKAPSTSLLAKGALYAMAATKLKAAAAAIAAAVLLVGVAVPTVYHFTATPGPALIPAPPPAVRSFPPPVSGNLPAGISAEPVAVARIADKRWFGPDGKPVSGIPDQSLTTAARLAPDATHAFVYRFTAPPGAAIGYGTHVEGTGGYGSSSVPDPATGVPLRLIGFPLAPDSDALTLTIRATDQPVTTNAVVPATAKGAFHGTIANHPLTANPPTEQGGRTRFGITFGEELPDVDLDVYAIDTAGNKVWHRTTGLIDGKLGSRYYEYTVPLSALREFRVESRPYNYFAKYTPVPLAPVK